MKRVGAVALACLMASPVGAQESSPKAPDRVRITGVSSYEIPGVIKLEGSQISGKAVRIADQFVQFRRPGDRQLLTVPRPGKRLTGKGEVIDDGLFEFVLDQETETLYVPLDSIAETESLEHTPHHLTTRQKVIIGLAAACGIVLAVIAWRAAMWGD